jgi:hypothetical protein
MQNYNFWPAEEEVTGDWRQLHVEELHDGCLSFNTLFNDVVNSYDRIASAKDY